MKRTTADTSRVDASGVAVRDADSGIQPIRGVDEDIYGIWNSSDDVWVEDRAGRIILESDPRWLRPYLVGASRYWVLRKVGGDGKPVQEGEPRPASEGTDESSVAISN